MASAVAGLRSLDSVAGVGRVKGLAARGEIDPRKRLFGSQRFGNNPLKTYSKKKKLIKKKTTGHKAAFFTAKLLLCFLGLSALLRNATAGTPSFGPRLCVANGREA